MATGGQRISRVAGAPLPMRGNDIDTDRIIPARFLRSIRFEGLEAHVFEDDRKALAEAGTPHPFDQPQYQGAAILLANANFGCGSSREHAPQALQRWGIQACVAESFSEIFLGNSTALGLPCATATPEAIAQLLHAAETEPATAMTLDLEALTVRAGDCVVEVATAPAVREALLSGTWDATGLLLDEFDDVRAVAARLPYVTGF
ncbi:MAG: 3-isopropylmalate dehydratase small subunit [Vicinamibacterales bacterium]|jgi:3-isopropylmalate/(R)-2-methylmalate dehydratase small subunit|nr:3-isopropylmalate dehydratase small subunit [Acidobacteriota bacterium]MDP7294949.1 3-isopropylmalate dehydratase small subunit [Vicinamibacterales bacterium]MDP7471547.1 3-isopropylmalate dehydratase small subunit [Vicinamibacterales bacterium]MDP7671232.1 3-isopropylmalate dehydratase small subunit [Vicinamibacterales bacterium]HJO38411.1 3-isopropylmalate dehydratase small subunit [Vicinamibacterales bacterium]|tara:strand:- start:29017 stop:29628 length:612 start_codon:yes stop_codon:yes gene_type:complete